uniref:Large delta antigen n=2 Tax=Hepatitis delta virus genotype I (isolate Japanese S-2) TaxID=10428 RepID=LHDAG_HDVS2|nr:RecName: Full=Large delta antigen; Short=L-HDAg; AltName: Full=p27; Flags: Precursor [Hepatitis delta virus (ISOLATE JAPANESE S-2)]
MSQSETRRGRRGTREETLEKWITARKKAEELEKDLRKARKTIKKLEEENPWLGNILGIIRKGKDGEGAPPAKRPRTDQMEVDSGPGKRPHKSGFTDKEREDHRRRKALENKKKQLSAGGKILSKEEEEELRRLTDEDEERKRRVAGPRVGDVNPSRGGPRGAPGGGFVPQMAGVPESPFSRTGEGLDIRGTQGFPWVSPSPPQQRLPLLECTPQ